MTKSSDSAVFEREQSLDQFAPMGAQFQRCRHRRAVLACCAFTGAGLAFFYAFPAPVVLLACALLVLMTLVFVSKGTSSWILPPNSPSSPGQAHLHWNPDIGRRGMGDLIHSVNHIGLVVSDVGRSLAFYTEIIGFQQIQRPNFDRHGAWLTMGNLELHLIKGVPNAPSGRDLIVSHIALETDQPDKVRQKLMEYDVPFRQNISVPDPKRARENLVESFENSEGKITQYSIRDPDGYYLEVCNCDILTAFCLFKEDESKQENAGHVPKYMELIDAMLGTYQEECGQVKASSFRFPQLLKTAVIIHRLVRRARAELKKSFAERVEKALMGVQEATAPDAALLAKFLGRQKTYCDICQGFSKEDLASALCKSGNSAPKALLLLAACRKHVRVCLPPQYLLSEGGRIKQQVMAVAAPNSPRRRAFGARSMFASKPFEDADPPSLSRSLSPERRVASTLLERKTEGERHGPMLSVRFEDDAKMQAYLQERNVTHEVVSAVSGAALSSMARAKLSKRGVAAQLR